MTIKQFLLHYYTWWHGATLGTLFYTRRTGELVGHDEFGNAYYRTKGRKIDPALGFERRWVIYNGLVGGLDDAARMERLVASHSRRGAD